MSESDSTAHIEGKPWTKKETLEDHLDAGETYQEIADQYEGASFDSVGYWVRKYDLTANHLRPKFTGNSVPLRLMTGEDIEHPVPEHFVEQYDLKGSQPARYTPVRRGVDLVVDIDVGDDITGEYSHERLLTERETRHLAARYPRMLAHAIGLPDIVVGAGGNNGGDDGVLTEFVEEGETAGESNADAYLKDHDDDTIRVEFSPSLTPWVPPTDAEKTREVADLDEKVKPLLPLFDSDIPQDDREVSDIEKYRLDLPLSYISAYDLSVQDDVSIHLGPVEDDGESKLGLFINFDGDRDTTHKSLMRRIQAYTNGTEDAPREQLCLYPGMTLLHALGIGVGQMRPSVRIEPGPRHIALIPL